MRSLIPRDIANVGLILAPTFRSRAYVQALAQNGLHPGVCLFLDAPEDAWDGPAVFEFPVVSGEPPLRFEPGVSARDTAAANGWATLMLETGDINSVGAINVVGRAAEGVLVYSGMAKALLKQPILDTGKRFLHVHGGYLPDYRGATGFYFGLLERGQLGESAIWLDKGVDTGPLIARRWYQPRPDAEIDRILDPMARAHLLVSVLNDSLEKGEFPSVQAAGKTESFFIIHPTLKHLALRRTSESEPIA